MYKLRFQCVIQIFHIFLVVFFCQSSIRLYRVDYFYDLCCSFFYGSIFTTSDSSEHCTAETRAFFAFDDIYFNVQNVSYDLSPERALCSTTTDFSFCDIDSEISCYFERITDRKGNTFQNSVSMDIPMKRARASGLL